MLDLLLDPSSPCLRFSVFRIKTLELQSVGVAVTDISACVSSFLIKTLRVRARAPFDLVRFYSGQSVEPARPRGGGGGAPRHSAIFALQPTAAGARAAPRERGSGLVLESESVCPGVRPSRGPRGSGKCKVRGGASLVGRPGCSVLLVGAGRAGPGRGGPRLNPPSLPSERQPSGSW